MTREKQRFVCGECGADFAQWQGRCTACGAWNSLKAFQTATGGGGRKSALPDRAAIDPIPLSEVRGDRRARLDVGGAEFSRVLGGGLTPGSVVLIAGDPGIGKSTLLMETLAALAVHERVLYVSGEESPEQLRQRGDRLGVAGERLPVLMENRLETVIRAVEKHEPSVLVVDSVQTLASDAVPSAAGSVTQVRECAGRLIYLAKQRHMAVFLVGHVTKDGQIAGPRVVEHMVDTVLYFEGERGHQFRILRAVKNRFGPADEIGVFEMTGAGLAEVTNPSALFLSERDQPASGSVVFAGIEGTRPVLVEIQALVAQSPLATPRRNVVGWDSGRLSMILAVLEARCGISFSGMDVYLNIAGGMRISEPAADLAVAAALISARQDHPLPTDTVIFGEISLSGALRPITQAEARLKEAAKLGFCAAIAPASVKQASTPEFSLKKLSDLGEFIVEVFGDISG